MKETFGFSPSVPVAVMPAIFFMFFNALESEDCEESSPDFFDDEPESPEPHAASVTHRPAVHTAASTRLNVDVCVNLRMVTTLAENPDFSLETSFSPGLYALHCRMGEL